MNKVNKIFLLLIMATSLPLTASEGTTKIYLENLSIEDVERMRTAADREDDYYIGVFIGSDQTSNEIVDTEGFANWGNAGWSVDYDERNPTGGILVGKRITINGVPLKIELDSTFGGVSASTNQLDPQGLDETATTDIQWMVTARAGLEKDLGPMKVFVNGGLAMAQVSNSVVDIDFGPNMPDYQDPDDSFSDNSNKLGLVFGVGGEIPLGRQKNWTLRMEGSYIHLGDEDYRVNHSGGGRCGPNGPRRPCIYKIKNRAGTVRVMILRRFSL